MKPMLAASVREDKGQSLEDIQYPVIASGKYDGIRSVNPNGIPKSRTLKPIPNRYVTKCLTHPGLIGLDGELMTGGEGEPFNTGPIMREDGKPDFTYYVFDDFTEPLAPYVERIESYEARVKRLRKEIPQLVAVETKIIRCYEELSDFTAHCLSIGLEGSMVRTPSGPYKFGRSTFKEGWLIKVKPMEDGEGKVIGFEEEMENTNEKTTNELGRSKRSSHKAGKVPKGTLGKLILMTKEFGEVRVAGFTDALAKHIWQNRPKYLGAIVTYRFQRVGMKDKPRIPVFKGFRHIHDL